MVINDFPIGQKLKAVTVIEDQDFNNNELCLDKIQLLVKVRLSKYLLISK